MTSQNITGDLKRSAARLVGQLFARFAGNDSGATAVIFGLVIIPLGLALALGIDVARMERIRSSNQQALDSALVGALAREGAEVEHSTVSKFYQANGGVGSVSEPRIEIGTEFVTATTDVTTTSALLFGWFMPSKPTEIHVQSEAKSPLRITEMKIEPDHASGWFIKTVKLFATLDGDPTPVELGSIVYRPSSPFSSTGTMTSTFGSDYVSIKNADAVWFEMHIDPTSEGLWASLKLLLRTNDPETSDYLFIDGKQLPKGQIVNLADIVTCGSQSMHSWEDGGNFVAQDFFYTVQGKCELAGTGIAHLSK